MCIGVWHGIAVPVLSAPLDWQRKFEGGRTKAEHRAIAFAWIRRAMPDEGKLGLCVSVHGAAWVQGKGAGTFSLHFSPPPPPIHPRVV